MNENSFIALNINDEQINTLPSIVNQAKELDIPLLIQGNLLLNTMNIKYDYEKAKKNIEIVMNELFDYQNNNYILKDNIIYMRGASELFNLAFISNLDDLNIINEVEGIYQSPMFDLIHMQIDTLTMLMIEVMYKKKNILQDWKKIKDILIKIFISLNISNVNDDYKFLTLHLDADTFAEITQAVVGIDVRKLERELINSIMNFNKKYSKELSAVKRMFEQTLSNYETERFIVKAVVNPLEILNMKHRTEVEKPIFLITNMDDNLIIHEPMILDNLFSVNGEAVDYDEREAGVIDTTINQNLLNQRIDNNILKYGKLTKEDIGKKIILSIIIENIYLLENFTISLKVDVLADNIVVIDSI